MHRSGQHTLMSFDKYIHPSNHGPNENEEYFPSLLKVHLTSLSVRKQDTFGMHCEGFHHARTGLANHNSDPLNLAYHLFVYIRF